MRLPTQKPTPSEFAVLTVVASLAFIGLGVVAVIVGLRAPAEQHELAAEVMRGGLFSLGIGVAIAVGWWLFRRFTD